MNELFRQLIDRYESENGFAQSYRDRSVEELEEVIIDFQSDYQYAAPVGNSSDLISIVDRLAFNHWEPCTQTEFLAYLAAKIAVARN